MKTFARCLGFPVNRPRASVLVEVKALSRANLLHRQLKRWLVVWILSVFFKTLESAGIRSPAAMIKPIFDRRVLLTEQVNWLLPLETVKTKHWKLSWWNKSFDNDKKTATRRLFVAQQPGRNLEAKVPIYQVLNRERLFSHNMINMIQH